jgi:hypothetical protein
MEEVKVEEKQECGEIHKRRFGGTIFPLQNSTKGTK